MKKLILISVLAISAVASAQQYSIDWHKIAGGGGSSSNAQYSVIGTIGQQDASSTMSGGGYSLIGGFWSIYAVQTPGAPLLTITCSGNQAFISWPVSATGWTLQTNNNVTSTNWGVYPGTVTGNRVTNSVLPGNLFFRLKQ